MSTGWTAPPVRTNPPSVCRLVDMKLDAETLARRFHEAHRSVASEQGMPDLGPWDDLPAVAKLVTIAAFEQLDPLFDSTVHDCCVTAAHPAHGMTVEEWLDAGRNAGFVGKEFCATHFDEGVPWTDDEQRLYDDDGIDSCTPSIRVFLEPPLPVERIDVSTLELPPATYPPFPNMHSVTGHDSGDVLVWTFDPDAVVAAVDGGGNVLQAAAVAAPAAQAAIGFGSKACRRDTEGCCIEFVDIPGYPEMQRLLGHDGFMEFGSLHVQGIFLARCYTPADPDGRWGIRHITTLNPLTEAQFDTARSDGWEINDTNLRRAVFTNPQWEGDRS